MTHGRNNWIGRGETRRDFELRLDSRAARWNEMLVGKLHKGISEDELVLNLSRRDNLIAHPMNNAICSTVNPRPLCNAQISIMNS
jgi:hypothetical protein